jgi:signal transduction histidine kinase/ligand-binding sensor domain-containing protein/DNA-binding response OmpR family regulator
MTRTDKKLRFYLATFLIAIILLGIPESVSSQNYDIRFEHISVEEGLSNSIIYDILQDSQGFMWFGTEDGLNKYDGYKYTIYRHDPDDIFSLSHSYIRSIYESHHGGKSVLWFGTWGGGLNKFDRDKEQFTHYQFDSKNPKSLSSNYVVSIFEDRSGQLWIASSQGLNRFNRETEEFTRYMPDSEYALNPDLHDLNYISGMTEYQPGVLWIGTFNGGLYTLELETGQFTIHPNDPKNPNSLSDNKINYIYQDHSGVLWIGTDYGGLNRFDLETEEFTQYLHDPNDRHSVSDNSIVKIHEDKRGILWIGTTEGGLNKFNRETEQFTRYMHDADNPNSLSNDVVWSIYKDKSDVLWVGTWAGLDKLDRAKQQFIHYMHIPGNPNSLSNNAVWPIYESSLGGRDVLWIGTWNGGLNKLDRRTEQFTSYLHDPINKNSLSNNTITTIRESRYGGENVLWIGTLRGLNKFNTATKQYKRYLHDSSDPQSISANVIRSMIKSQHGGKEVLWIGTHDGGLNKFDPQTEQFTRIGSFYQVMAMYEDQSEGVLWVGSFEGLTRLDLDSEQFTHYRHDPDDPKSIGHDEVISIFEDQGGVLWIGTIAGLNRFDRAKGQFTRYTEKDGLPNNVINGILQDKYGKLWISTNQGLSKFDTEAITFRNYDFYDGLQSSEFHHGVYWKCTDGQMFFGGTNGFNAFYPDSIEDNTHIPQVVITDFQIFNKSVNIKNGDTADNKNLYTIPKHIAALEEIELSYRESVFSFEFAALDYRSPERNQYAYMMDGFDEEWYYTDAKRRLATYTNLDPGKYVFRVKGSNNDGIWNEAGTSIRITITPPLWKTGWAYAIYILLLGASVQSVWRFQVSRLKLRHELEMEHFEADKLREIDEVKSRFFANISHEFRTPLTLIQGPLKQLLSDEFQGQPKKLYRMMLRNSRRLLELINQLLDLSKLESGRMILQARSENIIKIMRGLVLSFTSLAERKKIDLAIEASAESIIGYIDRDKTEKIITNLLSNAFKFTPEGGKISVSVKETIPYPMKASNSGVSITISDTGPGIPPDRLERIFDRFYQVDDSVTRKREGTGIGLALSKELVELHYGQIQVASEVGQGTTFTVKLPLGKQHLKPEEIVEASSEKLASPGIPISLTEVEATSQSETIPSSKKSLPMILIVEDNADVRSYIRSYLDVDYRNIEARNGEEGLQITIGKVPDLIISDIMMPKMDGIELCRRIKTDERTSHIPVILLTAKADVEAKIEGLETGADDYITKPFDARELQVRVRNLIEQRKRLRERFHRNATLKPKDITVTSMDERFLQRALEAIEMHMSDGEFDVAEFCRAVGMSRMNLHRKLRAITGQSTSEFIRILRLNRAAQLLTQKFGNVTEVAYEVGFSNPSYFTECFKKQFGQLPSRYSTANKP